MELYFRTVGYGYIIMQFPYLTQHGNYTPCNLLIASSDCHLLQIFEGLNYVIHISGLTYAVFTLNWT